MKTFNTDNELLDEIIRIIKNYDSSKGEKNVSIQEVSDMIENHKFEYDFGYATALEMLSDYRNMRTILDPFGESLSMINEYRE